MNRARWSLLGVPVSPLDVAKAAVAVPVLLAVLFALCAWTFTLYGAGL